MGTDWIEVPIPDGAVEYTYDFMKEDLRHCRGKLAPKYKPKEEEGTVPIEYYRALREKSGYIPGTFAVGDSKQRWRIICTGISQDGYTKMASDVCSDVSWVQSWDM